MQKELKALAEKWITRAAELEAECATPGIHEDLAHAKRLRAAMYQMLAGELAKVAGFTIE